MTVATIYNYLQDKGVGAKEAFRVGALLSGATVSEIDMYMDKQSLSGYEILNNYHLNREEV